VTPPASNYNGTGKVSTERFHGLVTRPKNKSSNKSNSPTSIENLDNLIDKQLLNSSTAPTIRKSKSCPDTKNLPKNEVSTDVMLFALASLHLDTLKDENQKKISY